MDVIKQKIIDRKPVFMLGYGASGAGAAIGPNETLIFVVDLVKVS